MNKVRTWNQHVVKKENKGLVLDTIMQHTPISRAEIANRTSLNKGTVSSLVSDLIEEKMIYESGPGESSGGRRPVILHFNQMAGCSIGIDLGVNYILGVLTDLSGNILLEKYVEHEHESYNYIMDQVISIIDHLIEEQPDTPYKVIGIGIGIPGAVNTEGGIMFAPNLNWENREIRTSLEQRYNLPIIIENEANAGCYGEKKYGVGKRSNHILYISIGVGIGIGMMLNGTLYRGNNGFSGEMGHMTIDLNGDLCPCGNRGCWELYASEKGLHNAMDQYNIPPAHDGQRDLEYLIDLAEEGDQRAVDLFAHIGKYIGLGVNNIVNTFNPEQVIIGNRMSSAQKWIGPTIENNLDGTLWFQKKDLNLDFSGLSTHSSAMGIAAFSIENFLMSYQKAL
ncbi:ROK family transcriptional regulator [Salinicoccus roseus]|uniref:ROK family protein n=1 Tax=Salinicoccus roseus TaxID=45670 RepID=A0A0C2HM59_9STAP|nr:ROK family transcriptional regulator [Salinicoccus roseus]KIH70656.1 ROK family protein [Salinicoccus roseus]MDB0580760.1 ROK family transcriptional regulator [Salinicoccus roseus]